MINLSELSPALTCDTMRSHLLCAAQTVFGLTATEILKIDREKIAAYAAHFGDKEFLYDSHIPFNVSCKGQLPFGNVELGLCVKNGYVTDLKLYTDALDAEISATVKQALVSLPFDLQAIRDALSNTIGEADANAFASLFLDQIFS